MKTLTRGYKYVVIHHFGKTTNLTAEQGRQSMQRTWVDSGKKKNIPAHFIVGSDGSFVKVNDLSIPVGATQNADANWNGIHIEVVGNFNETTPTDTQYATVKQLIKRIKEKYPDIQIKFHRDFQPHSCPGTNFDINKIIPFSPIPHANGAKRPLPYIKGITVYERAKSFARSFGFSYDGFTKPGNKYGIKPEVLLCIAFAEGFGKGSGSTGNIMNCMNNDRGDRVSFDSRTSSVICAASKLKYGLLKNKQTIGDLSYAGNGKIDMKYIYASSTGPREINMRNCLGKIYDTNLSSDFKFRNEN